MYCLAIHCSIVAIMNKSQQDGLVGPPAERSTEGKEKKKRKEKPPLQSWVGPNCKNPPKTKKKFVKLTDDHAMF